MGAGGAREGKGGQGSPGEWKGQVRSDDVDEGRQVGGGVRSVVEATLDWLC